MKCLVAFGVGIPFTKPAIPILSSFLESFPVALAPSHGEGSMSFAVT